MNLNKVLLTNLEKHFIIFIIVKQKIIKPFLFIFSILLVLITLIIPAILISPPPISTTPPIGEIIIQNSWKNVTNYTETILPNRSNYDDVSTKNAIEIDTQQKASTTSAIVYYITGGGVLHKFGFLAHILSLLEKNPNKEIYVFTSENLIDLSFISSYKNIKTFTVYGEGIYLPNNLDQVNEDLLTTIENLHNQNITIDFYCDDFVIFEALYVILELDYIQKEYLDKILLKYQAILYKSDSVNIFADGTHSTKYYSTFFYKLFGIYGNDYNEQLKIFKKSDEMFNYYKNIIKENSTILNKNIVNNYEDIFYFFLSPLITNENSNQYTGSKIFLASTQMIIEMNENLETNKELIKNNENNFFDPYNSLSSGLIHLIQKLNQNSFQNLLIGLKTNLTSLTKDDEQFNFMNDSVNYIYSGRLLIDLTSNELDIEGEKIYKLYKLAKENTPPPEFAINQYCFQRASAR